MKQPIKDNSIAIAFVIGLIIIFSVVIHYFSKPEMVSEKFNVETAGGQTYEIHTTHRCRDLRSAITASFAMQTTIINNNGIRLMQAVVNSFIRTPTTSCKILVFDIRLLPKQ